MLRPAHFTHVDKALNARSDFNKCSVVGHNNYLAGNLVANLEVLVELVPWMWLKLLQTQSNALLFLVEIEDNNVELLVGLYDVGRIAYAAPREVGNVDKTIHSTEVDEYTVGGDVLNSTLKYLTLLKLSNDFLALLLKLGLDECLVRYNNVLVLLVDFHNLELHSLVDKHVVVADGLHVDLAARQESLDAKYINDHTALSATLDVTLNDFIVFKRLINALPTLSSASLLMRKHQLALVVLLILNKHLNGVAYLQVGIAPSDLS